MIQIQYAYFSDKVKLLLTVVVKNGCFNASDTVILFSGSTTKHFLIKSFGSSKMVCKIGFNFAKLLCSKLKKQT